MCLYSSVSLLAERPQCPFIVSSYLEATEESNVQAFLSDCLRSLTASFLNWCPDFQIQLCIVPLLFFYFFTCGCCSGSTCYEIPNSTKDLATVQNSTDSVSSCSNTLFYWLNISPPSSETFFSANASIFKMVQNVPKSCSHITLSFLSKKIFYSN